MDQTLEGKIRNLYAHTLWIIRKQKNDSRRWNRPLMENINWLKNFEQDYFHVIYLKCSNKIYSSIVSPLQLIAIIRYFLFDNKLFKVPPVKVTLFLNFNR